MTKESPYIIFSPHCDDELIGCYRLLAEKKVSYVYYFFELTDERVHEVHICSKIFNFIPVFFPGDGSQLNKPKHSFFFSPDAILLLPNIKDTHPHHKSINAWGRQFQNKKSYFSVDMNTKQLDVLEKPIAHSKLDALNTIYPSQKVLWENEKYHLFESLLLSDLGLTISISTSFEGIHCYPDAPDDVDFLRHSHRHIFHVKAEIETFHQDRELEFIQIKRKLEIFIRENLPNLQYRSCEMIGEEIVEWLLTSYGQRQITVTVSEDNENGATVRYNY